MTWIQIELKTTADQCEALEDLLLECGACSVTLLDAADQPIYEPDLGTTPLWSGTLVQGLFTADVDMQEVVGVLKSKAPGAWQACRVDTVKDKVWEKEWMNDFHPMQFGDNLWVCPSWCEPPDAEAVNVMLDPGCGFGTGTHPTTAMCLQWLGDHSIQNKVVIDYGCGSGILAISAMLLGAKSALCVDIDPQALEASTQNAERNEISRQHFSVAYPQNVPDCKADIVLANILSGPLTELAPTLAALVKSDGDIVLSGILLSQVDSIMEAYQPWFTMELPKVSDEWVRLTGKRLS